MAKRLLAAGYLRDLLFDTVEELELYLYKIEHQCLEYRILDRYDRDDGSVIVRVLQQYNQADLIQL